jgi:hypothetical protein
MITQLHLKIIIIIIIIITVEVQIPENWQRYETQNGLGIS